MVSDHFLKFTHFFPHSVAHALETPKSLKLQIFFTTAFFFRLNSWSISLEPQLPLGSRFFQIIFSRTFLKYPSLFLITFLYRNVSVVSKSFALSKASYLNFD